jgi:anhydro-N-acetylmuramic acid kinase
VIVLGMISGTSHDGIDVAAVDFTLSGDMLLGSISCHDTIPYEPSLRARLLAGSHPRACPWARSAPWTPY